MKAIYAFYSKPFGTKDIRTANTHWSIPYIEFLVMSYSVLKSKSFGLETVLFCDRYGKELIIDTFGIPFDEVRVELDYCEIKPRFWAAGKIYAYTKGLKEFEPYVMFDNDAGFHTKPPEHFFKSLYRCQSIHNDNGTEFARYVNKIVNETKDEYPFDIFHEMARNVDGIKGGNAGLVVMNDKRLWSEFTRYTWDLMNHSYFDKVVRDDKKEVSPYRALRRWNVTVEENVLFQLSRRLNYQMPETVYEFTGFAPPMNVHNPSGFFHIWGSKKNIKFLKAYEDIAVNYIPNDITERVYKYFNIKS